MEEECKSLVLALLSLRNKIIERNNETEKEISDILRKIEQEYPELLS